MTFSRSTTPTATNAVASLVADLDAIARIESSLGSRTRHTAYRGRPDFSRLARLVPNLKL